MLCSNISTPIKFLWIVHQHKQYKHKTFNYIFRFVCIFQCQRSQSIRLNQFKHNCSNCIKKDINKIRTQNRLKCITGISWQRQHRCCNSSSNRNSSRHSNHFCKSITLSWCVAYVRLILKLPPKVYPFSTPTNWWTKSKTIFTYR